MVAVSYCSVLEKSLIGAKSDFEVWALKVFLKEKTQGGLVGGCN